MSALPEGPRCGLHGTDTSSGRCAECDMRPLYPRTIVHAHPDAMMVPIEELYRLQRAGVAMDVLMAGVPRTPTTVRTGTWSPAGPFLDNASHHAAGLRLAPSGMVVIARYTPVELTDTVPSSDPERLHGHGGA